MKVIDNATELRLHLSTTRKNDTAEWIFVPTMGGLHYAHQSLFQQAKERGNLVVSIFVNPLQFNELDDFESYPRSLEADLAICRELGADLVFTPRKQDFLQKENLLKLDIPSFCKHLCGKSRPGHLQGVLFIVLKLLCLIQPTIAIFGKKDFQQYRLVQRMASELDLGTEIIGAELVREDDGLACSSRNVNLSLEAREQASLLYRALKMGKQLYENKANYKDISLSEIRETMADIIETGSLNQVDYLDFIDSASLELVSDEKLGDSNKEVLIAGAIFCDKIHLIDNMPCVPSP